MSIVIIMKFSWLDENDSDIRSVLKTFPWVISCVIIFLGFILVSTILSGSVTMRDGYSPIHFKMVEIPFQQNPVFYISIVALEALLVGLCVAYWWIRLRIRARLLREDRKAL